VPENTDKPVKVVRVAKAKGANPKGSLEGGGGLLARFRAIFAHGNDESERPGVDGLLAASSRVLTGVTVVVVLGSWAFGRGALERHVASFNTKAPEVVFEWPLAAGASRSDARTWVPKPVQNDLTRVVQEHITSSPFDQAALVRAAEELKSTGWFTKLGAVHREAGGKVRITGEWRGPAAVVKKDGKSHLVAMDGAILKLPSNTEPPERLFVISNPSSPAPLSDAGTTAFGVPWMGNDVQSAIALLKLLNAKPEVSRQLAGVDLSEYARSTKLVLVTDKGHRIVWGSPIGDLLPGEVAVERKVARLVQNLKDFGRIDADQSRVEIYTPVVMVDKTAPVDEAP
jgi:hypothetical protein